MSEEQRENIRQAADKSGQHIKDFVLEAIDEQIKKLTSTETSPDDGAKE